MHVHIEKSLSQEIFWWHFEVSQTYNTSVISLHWVIISQRHVSGSLLRIQDQVSEQKDTAQHCLMLF